MELSKALLSRWQTYFALRDEGMSVELAAARSGTAPTSAYRYERGEANSQGVRAALHFDRSIPANKEFEVEAVPLQQDEAERETPPEAIRALTDFAYFRYRYFGRKSMPWQVEAAEQVASVLATPDREYVVMNEPPGSGKSTLFTNDIVCWMVCRDRSIRVQIGSRTERQARMYVGRIKRSLERLSPMVATAEDKDIGIAFDALACLSLDYGNFRPSQRDDLWRADAIVVKQHGGVSLDDKEPTVSAWGMDSGFLGGRFDLVIWDDLVDRKTTSTLEAREKLTEWYFTEAESRLEPGGMLLLQGQRIAADDLYRSALDQTTWNGKPKYKHIVYPAHDDIKCTMQHGKGAKAWPKGCLLDPYRLPYHQLETIRNNSPRVYSVMYQQTDGITIGGLVESAWLEGGVDSQGLQSVGCYDMRRIIKQPPLNHSAMYSFITVDPSPTEWWGVIRWLYDPNTAVRWVMDVQRLKMRPDDWLWFDLDTLAYTGLLPRMVKESEEEGNPVSNIIVEINAAQRWLLAQPHVQRWSGESGVHFIQHTTTRNKLDPEYGVESLAPLFREGRVRIPWGSAASRIQVKPLVDELLRYPEGQTTDLVMSTWFSVMAVDNHYRGQRAGAWAKQTPTWFRGIRRGIA